LLIDYRTVTTFLYIFIHFFVFIVVINVDILEFYDILSFFEFL